MWDITTVFVFCDLDTLKEYSCLLLIFNKSFLNLCFPDVSSSLDTHYVSLARIMCK